MLTLTKIRAQIFDLMNSYSNYSNIEPRLIDDLVAQKRSKFIRQDVSKGRVIDDNFIQSLGCVELELVDKASDNCCSEITGCNIFRTKQKLPNAVELPHDKAITKVGSVDIISYPFYFMEYQAAPFWGNGRFNKKSIGVFLRNNYMYFIYNEGIENLLLEKVNIQGVWEDPKEASKFKNCDGTPCWTVDSSYPLNDWMWEIIRDEVIKELLLKYKLPVDLDNNAKDDTEPTAGNQTQSN